MFWRKAQQGGCAGSYQKALFQPRPRGAGCWLRMLPQSMASSALLQVFPRPTVHHPVAGSSVHTGRRSKLKPAPQQPVKRCLQQPTTLATLAPLSSSHLGHFQLGEGLLFLWKFKPGAGSCHHPTLPSILPLQHIARVSEVPQLPLQIPAMFPLATAFPANSSCIPSGKP